MSRHRLDREAVLRHIAENPGQVTKRDIARALGVKGGDRVELKEILRELQHEGLVERGRGRRMVPHGVLPRVVVALVIAVDEDGDLRLRPAAGDADPDVRLHLPLEAVRGRPPGVGDRVLVSTERRPDGAYDCTLIRILPQEGGRVLGVVEAVADGYTLKPANRKQRSMRLDPHLLEGAVPGDLVSAEALGPQRLGLARARVVARFGRGDDPRQFSRLAAAELQLPEAFAPDALDLADRVSVPGLDARVDLRELPLVTIDGADARDFDDAVHARPDDEPDNEGGHVLTVAIADVAHYVRPGDALDREAKQRGNSVYFPDRVIPMLPEPLSNGVCSLRPNENRACLAVEMIIDRNGRLVRHRFGRGLMRSAARLTYEQVQNARDGRTDDLTGPLLGPVIGPLFAAWEALDRARQDRGTLDLDLPERVVQLGEDGRPVRIATRERLDAHRLIEEFMVLANVAAAETLMQRRRAGLFRVHDRPDPVKIEALAQFLQGLGIGWKASGLRAPKDFDRLLATVREHPLRETINGYVLRAQSQAVYAPDDIGHFGLNLRHYAHFTSPIRRYADLVVHRALIEALDLGPGGVRHAHTDLVGLGQDVSQCERRAMEAERKTMDRYVALFLQDRVGAKFGGRVTGVQKVGLFVRLDDVGADAFVPISTLGHEYFVYDEAQSALFGERSGEHFGLGDRVEVELVEADSLTGGLLVRIVDHTPVQERTPKGRIGRRMEGLAKRRGGRRRG
ncbi:MAG: ribonuclease R [Pseudomonadota bacterium]